MSVSKKAQTDGRTGDDTEATSPGNDPSTCNWCEADLPDLERTDGELRMRLHNLVIVRVDPGDQPWKEEGGYVKVKVRCANCGYVNVLVGRIPSSNTIMPLPKDTLKTFS